QNRLDIYIYDYFVKRNLQTTAKAFQSEGNVSMDPVAIDAPGGFLFEWWSIFWDIFIAQIDREHSDVATSYIETQQAKAEHKKQQQQQYHHQQHQHQQIQMQQMLLQRAAQQQQQLHRDGCHLLNGITSGFSGNDLLMRHNPATANAMAVKIYEERLKLPSQRDSLDEASIKLQQRYGEKYGQVLDLNQASLLKADTCGQSSGPILPGGIGDLSSTLQQVQARSPRLPILEQNIKTRINPILTNRDVISEGSLLGLQGSNHGGRNFMLKGWPLMQKPFLQSPQQFQQLQFLTPQQQLLLQTHQNMASLPANDVETRRLWMLHNNKNMAIHLDGQINNNSGHIIPNIGSPDQIGGSRNKIDMLIAKIAHLQQLQQQGHSQQQQLQQSTISHQQAQSLNQLHHQQAQSVGSMLDGSIPNSFGLVNRASKKRKKIVSSSGRANSSGTSNNVGSSSSSAPSIPFTHTPGDAMSMPQLKYNGGKSKSLSMFGYDDTKSLISPANPPGDVDQLQEDGSLDENVESFLSQEDMDPQETMGHCMDASKGFGFIEVAKARASTNKVDCCHFSSDGKLLATGGHDKKVVLWFTDDLNIKATLEEHSMIITDVRFSSIMTRLATSSFDKTIRVWDANNPEYSLHTFIGHSTSVVSLDFHPNKEDIICSCDSDGEVRCWSIDNGSCVNCVRVFNGGAIQLRFQPHHGKYLAVVSEKMISILDAETLHIYRSDLQGHLKNIHSVCWDATGGYLASVSEDSIKYLELWDIRENNIVTINNAHDGMIPSLAASNASGLIASIIIGQNGS
uniref:LisH domain-containing protein n=1 Tax=Oryza glaberrima TaxID=4538 RepID=I1NPI5_ORYGL